MNVGIEAINIFGGCSYIDARQLAAHRNLNRERVESLLVFQKSVPLPFEDPVTYAANAAKPIVESLSEKQRERIELLITCTESPIDFAKSISSYLQSYLNIPRSCRFFELKQACYGGTAGLQMATNFVLSQTSPGAKALVIATDISRTSQVANLERGSEESGYAEITAGGGAAALLIGDTPKVFQLDVGANGYYGYDITDTCRPAADVEVVNSDLSLLSYLDCCQQTFERYKERVSGADYSSTFRYLCFHAPFGGMVRGAHRAMMRRYSNFRPDEIEADFSRRVMPALNYCLRTGNAMTASIFISLAGLINSCHTSNPLRAACFSYGSGCCSEFFSGIIFPDSRATLARFEVESSLNARHQLSLEEYDDILSNREATSFGIKDCSIDSATYSNVIQRRARYPCLLLREISNFQRDYVWAHELSSD